MVKVIIIINRENNHPVPDRNLFEYNKGADRVDCPPIRLYYNIHTQAPRRVRSFSLWPSLLLKAHSRCIYNIIFYSFIEVIQFVATIF